MVTDLVFRLLLMVFLVELAVALDDILKQRTDVVVRKLAESLF